nr:phosphopantothenoylcysteine decarboxylase-like [Tanacetum cinerariifolium]
QVILTEAATAFVTPLTLGTLSKKPVLTGFLRDAASGQWHNHVELGLWADAYVIAPASANTIGQLANGLCPNLLSAVYLSARCPVFLAPAMDLDMYAHPAVTQNMQRLRSFGNHGWLAAVRRLLFSTLMGSCEPPLPYARSSYRWTYLRAPRPGALLGQPLDGQNGLRAGRSFCRDRGRGYARERPGAAACASPPAHSHGARGNGSADVRSRCRGGPDCRYMGVRCRGGRLSARYGSYR